MLNEIDELLLSSYYIKQKKYWESKLEGIPKTNLGYCADIRKDDGYKITDAELTEELTSSIIEFGKKSDILIYVILLAGFKGLFYRYYCSDNISIISPVYKPLTSDNTLNKEVPIINSIKADQNFKELLKQIKNTVVEAYNNQDYPFTEILKSVNSENNISDILFTYIPIHEELKEDIFKTNLRLTFLIKNRRIHFKIEYNTNKYKSYKIYNLIEHFKKFLEIAFNEVNTPISKIDYLSHKEKQQIITDFNNTKADFPKDKTVIGLFENQVKKNPQKVALIFENKKLRYDEFKGKVDQLTNFLIKKGVCKGDIIGIISERSIEMMVGIYAIQKAGGVYLPIAPYYPEDRILYIIENSKPKLVLCQDKYLHNIKIGPEIVSLSDDKIFKYPEELCKSFCTPNDLSYIIYTSGSTGNPKGVMIEHHSLVNRIHWMGRAYPITSNDIIIQKTTIVFDVSVWELFWWAVDGASLFLLDPDEEKNPLKIIESIEEHNISIIHFVPSMLNVFLQEISDNFEYKKLKTLKYVFSSGEALGKSDVLKFNKTLFKENSTKLINLYGPTEASIDVTYFNCSPFMSSDIIPIGKPIDNIKLYIIDKYNMLLPVGVPGELCICGVGVARGYLNNEKLTNEKFVQCLVENNGKMYKTGDLVQWLPDGNIEFLGRMDNQIKIRGYRIELGEIESQLTSYNKIDRAIVIDEGEGIDKILVAYYLSENKIDKGELQQYISKKLPYYMVPLHFVHLKEFPLTNNGKIDRKSLPKAGFSKEKERVPPRNEMEQQIAEIWAELLNLEVNDISVNDGFFELGGNSIKILKLTYSINQLYNCNITVTEIFDKNRITDLVEFIKSGEDDSINNIEEEIDESLKERNEFLSIENLLE